MPLTLRDHRLKVFENKILRRILAPRGTIIENGECFIMRNYDLYGSLNTMKVIEMRDHVTRMQDSRNFFKISIKKPIGKSL